MIVARAISPTPPATSRADTSLTGSGNENRPPLAAPVVGWVVVIRLLAVAVVAAVEVRGKIPTNSIGYRGQYRRGRPLPTEPADGGHSIDDLDRVAVGEFVVAAHQLTGEPSRTTPESRPPAPLTDD